jgi:hypothetical protein
LTVSPPFGIVSIFEEYPLNFPDKEEKSWDDGELWMNLHEDSLLREFGISLDALENDTISKIDPDANNFQMMNHDNNSQDDAPHTPCGSGRSVSSHSVVRLGTTPNETSLISPEILEFSLGSNSEVLPERHNNNSPVSLQQRPIQNTSSGIPNNISCIDPRGLKIVGDETTSHYQNAYNENVNESRLGN